MGLLGKSTDLDARKSVCQRVRDHRLERELPCLDPAEQREPGGEREKGCEKELTNCQRRDDLAKLPNRWAARHRLRRD